MSSLECRERGTKATLRGVAYVMPDPEDFDFQKYAVGGCCVSGDGLDPDVRSRKSDRKGFARTSNS